MVFFVDFHQPLSLIIGHIVL